MITLAILLATLTAPNEDFSKSALEKGKAALSRGGYPWYDNATDDVKALAPPDRRPNWFARFLEWFFGLVKRLNFFSALGGVTQILVYLLLAFVFGLVMYLIVVNWAAIVSLVKGHKPETVVGIAKPRIEELRLGLPAVDDLLGEARRLRELGRLQDAAVYLYAHLLSRLDQKGVVEIALGKTNRRYQSEVQRRAALAKSDFDAAVLMFEDAFFGRMAISPERFDRVFEAAKRVERVEMEQAA